jgi:hypothetical protein
MDVDEYREAMFQLCYTQHGGSGLGLTFGDVQEMPLADVRWYLERLGEARRQETDAIKSAAKRVG